MEWVKKRREGQRESKTGVREKEGGRETERQTDRQTETENERSERSKGRRIVKGE